VRDTRRRSESSQFLPRGVKTFAGKGLARKGLLPPLRRDRFPLPKRQMIRPNTLTPRPPPAQEPLQPAKSERFPSLAGAFHRCVGGRTPLMIRPAAWSALRRSPQGTDCGSMRDMLVSGTTPAARQFLTTLFAKRCLGNRTARAVPRHSKRHGAFATVLPASKPGRTRRYAEAAPPANRAGGGR